MRIDMTFNEWFRKVDEDMLRIGGIGTDGITDKRLHNWYDDGYTPIQAAETALMNRGYQLKENYYLG
jgi:hypothetical protein